MIPLIFNKSITFVILLILVTPAALASPNKPYPVKQPDIVLKVGVRAVNGLSSAKKMWGETIDFLSNNIHGYKFKLVPIVNFNDMRTAAKNKRVDFILTNPLAYIELNKQSGVTRILTLNKKQPNGVASTTFSSVIFTRSDRKDILNLKDIKQKSILAVHAESFGGWRMALRELLHNKIDPYKDCSSVSFTSDNTHKSVVNSILSGKSDVGVVRTGIIEQLVSQGKLDLYSIRVLNPHEDELSALHSTQHYPEWPFSVLPHVSDEISNKVFHSLLSIKPNSIAAIAGEYKNWTAPLDYNEIYDLNNELSQQYITFEKVWEKYWLDIILFHIFLISIILYTLYLFSINKKLLISEQSLSEHRDHLEEIVEMRTTELTEEKEKSDKANKAKSEFLSNMSHELRTPLNAILGFSEILKVSKEDRENNANEIINAGNYLLSLINEILDLAKIESGESELHLESVSCNDTLNSSLDMIKPLADIKNITININCHVLDGGFVFADQKRLHQICINLLSNAVKYNKQNGFIDITVVNNTPTHYKFSIKDSGLGIKPEFYHKVFQPFVRDQSNADVIEGTGVGLVITKHLVEQMQGEIGFNSEYGICTEFWVILPIHES